MGWMCGLFRVRVGWGGVSWPAKGLVFEAVCE